MYIDYITIASGGNAIDFGNLQQNGRYQFLRMFIFTRGLIAGGYPPGLYQCN